MKKNSKLNYTKLKKVRVFGELIRLIGNEIIVDLRDYAGLEVRPPNENSVNAINEI